MAERVMVVKKELLNKYINNENQKFITDNKELFIEHILKEHTFLDRGIAEYNYDYKQIIPYIVICNSDNFLVLKRTNKQTEKRLHNMYSIGIGGHINPDNTERYPNNIISGLYKELNEEILLDGDYNPVFQGIINENDNDVSQVHLGLLYLIKVESSKFEILETEKMTGEWVSKIDFFKFLDMLESWSKIVYDYIIKEELL